MTTIFKPIRPKKISEEIVNQIKELIVKGDLKPGDRIPSERELAVITSYSIHYTKLYDLKIVVMPMLRMVIW